MPAKTQSDVDYKVTVETHLRDPLAATKNHLTAVIQNRTFLHCSLKMQN